MSFLSRDASNEKRCHRHLLSPFPFLLSPSLSLCCVLLALKSSEKGREGRKNQKHYTRQKNIPFPTKKRNKNILKLVSLFLSFVLHSTVLYCCAVQRYNERPIHDTSTAHYSEQKSHSSTVSVLFRTPLSFSLSPLT